MLTERLKERCPTARPMCVASTEGFTLEFNKKSVDGSGKATLVAANALRGKVYGVLFEMNDVDLPALDRAESSGRGYCRNNNFVVRSGGQEQAVVTYMAAPDAIEQNLRPYDWYLDLVLAGARQHRLPSVYIEELVTTLSVSDLAPNRESRLLALSLLAGVDTS